MERLTVMTPRGAALKMDDTYPDEGAARADLMRRYCVAVNRLAAYEDTGLEPEEISGLCSMYERSKMADPLRLEEYKTLGTIDHLRELAQAENDGRLVVLQCKPGQKIWAESPIKGMAYCFDAPDIAWIIENAELFGKEIFLSCEEAEAAMNKREEARGNGAVGFQ